MNLLEKLDLQMSQRGLNKSTLSKLSGVPYMTLSDIYKKGYANAKMSTIQKLARALDVSLDYLLLDEITDPAYGRVCDTSESFHISESERHLILSYRSLSSEGKSYIQQQMSIACTMFAGKNNAAPDLEAAD